MSRQLSLLECRGRSRSRFVRRFRPLAYLGSDHRGGRPRIGCDRCPPELHRPGATTVMGYNMRRTTTLFTLRMGCLGWKTTWILFHMHKQQVFNVPRGTRPMTDAGLRSPTRGTSEETETQRPLLEGVGQATAAHARGMIGSVTCEGYAPSW